MSIDNETIELASGTDVNSNKDSFANPIKFEDVEGQSTNDYFNGNKFSVDAWAKKYALNEKETYVEGLTRICKYIASVEETDELKEYWEKRWFNEIYNDWWHPSGSIMQGAGSGRGVSLCNCTTCYLGVNDDDKNWDNLESIIKNLAYTVAKSAAYRQGLGVDFSKLRPRGTSVCNSANESTGSVHWMQFIDQIGYFVGQKGRIPAMLFSLNVKHPDIEEFITVKSDYTKIQNANISVQCTDAFYNAVEADEDWELRFDIPATKKGEKIYVDQHSATMETMVDEKGWYNICPRDREAEVFSKIVKAKKIFKLIAKNMWENGEPGIQNIDVAKYWSNSDYMYDPNDAYDTRIASTNACSEQYLSRESLCVLASLNNERFDVDPDQYEKELSVVASSMNRFLDNVNECELVYDTYATPHQKMAIDSLRRTGAGYTNVAGWLFKNNLEYGSEEGNAAVEHFTERFNYHLYRNSIELGHEKGSFGSFDKEKFEKSPFIQHMMDLGLVFDAMRNVTTSSIAPTGTLSLMFRTFVMSYGIEQAFGLYFWKRTRMAGKYEYYFCVPNIVRKVFEDGGYPLPMEADTVRDTWDGKIGREVIKVIDERREEVGIKFTDAVDVDPLRKIDLMARVMKNIDSSISVTYMLPEDTKVSKVAQFLLEGWKKGVKSIAAFPDRKMYGIISFEPFKELAFRLQDEGVYLHHQNFDDKELEALNIAKDDVKLQTGNIPKREKTLDADIHSVTVRGEKFVVVVGLQNGYPYEIFGGHMNGFGIKHKNMKGKITKVGKGVYALEFGDIIIDDFSTQFTPVEQILFRSASLCMRHGVPMQHIVEQLAKGSDDISSLTSATVRVMKKYIEDGQKVSGKPCPQCEKHELIYHDGCVKCSCGYEACS
tara:strand:+ start:3465 stop:6119 length:2655 start_codon:yes stop_codon:yes gene_type:complete